MAQTGRQVHLTPTYLILHNYKARILLLQLRNTVAQVTAFDVIRAKQAGRSIAQADPQGEVERPIGQSEPLGEKLSQLGAREP